MTDWTNPRTWNIGELVTKALMDTEIRDHFNALWVGTAVGDLEYYSTSTRKTRIPKGTNGQIFQMVSGIPAWADGARYWTTQLNDNSSALVAGDDGARFRIPTGLNGWKITYVAACRKSGGTGVLTLQLRNVTTGVDILSTKLTVDSGSPDSSGAGTPAVINSSNATVSSNQTIAWDVDDAGTNTLIAVAQVGFTRS